MVIDVVDSGAGIPEADRERVFERFQRGNSPSITGRASTGGTGLGLAISRWAVGIHGGTIEARSDGDQNPRRRAQVHGRQPCSAQIEAAT